MLEEHLNPLCGLPLELLQLSGNNVLERLKVIVTVGADEPCRTDSDDWSNLDAVLTDQGAFPKLREVAVDLVWTSCDRNEEEVNELLDNLTRDHFPRLLESSAIRFQFDEEHYYIG